MSISEIESALSELRPEELDRVEEILRDLRQRELAGEEERLERETGFAAIPRRAGPMVTTGDVLRICDEEGI